MIVGQGLFYNCLIELKQPDLQKKKLDFDNLTRLLYLSSLSHYSSSVSRIANASTKLTSNVQEYIGAPQFYFLTML